MITDLVDAFNQLQNRLDELSTHLLKTQPPHWIPLNDAESNLKLSPLAIGVDLLADLWYRGQQDGRETRSRHGLILADDTACSLIRQINDGKDTFRACVQAEKADTKHWKQALECLNHHQHATPLREKLVMAGLNRVHLKQCFRHIPLLDTAPAKVGFSWYTNGRSIKTITVQQAEQKLLDIGDNKPHIQVQLTRLGQLRPGTRLAQVQTLAPVVRANLVFESQQEKQKETIRKAMNVSMPLFIQDSSGVLPAHNRITSEPPSGRTRQARGDQQLSDEPLLPSIRVYTYIR